MSSKVNTGQVVIFKAPNDSGKEQRDIYYDILTENGFQVIKVPVLDFEFINLDELLLRLKCPDDYSGIIFSSPRCVEACKLASDRDRCPETIWTKWKCQKNYSVGETTAKLAEEIGLVTFGKESGNANALADVISKGEYEKPFLYPTGSLTTNNFKLKLKESNIDVDDIVTYKTKPHPQLRENLKDLFSKIVDPVYFLYFSPSGANYTLPILKDLRFNLDYVKFVAIGPTTESNLREHGLQVYRTLSKPTPAAMLEALTS